MDPRDGGPPEVVRQLAHVAHEAGDTIEIACQDGPAQTFLHSLPCSVHALGPVASIYGYSGKLRVWLERNIGRFDGLIIHGIWQYVTLAGSKAALGRIPYFVFTHGGLDPWFKRQYPLKHIKKYIYWPLLYPALHHANGLLSTGKLEQELAKISFWPHSWSNHVVPLGIQSPAGNSQSQIESFYTQLPALRNRPFLLFMARIHEKKGCDLLIRAFARLGTQYPSIDLVMAGPDQTGLRAELQPIVSQSGLEGRVHWPGMLTGDTKYGAYRACDAFVLPSHQENFGISVAEALACGRPVLISNQVAIWEEIQQSGAGLVDGDSPEGTERLLKKWLELGQDERNAMAMHAFPCFEKHFSIRHTARTLHDLFQEEAQGSQSKHSGILLHGRNAKSDVVIKRDT